MPVPRHALGDRFALLPALRGFGRRDSRLDLLRAMTRGNMSAMAANSIASVNERHFVGQAPPR